MTDLPSPEDLAATDIALNRLSERRHARDPALAALGRFAQDVDRRAQALATSQSRPPTQPAHPAAARAGTTADVPTARSGQTKRPPGRPRPRLRRRLLAVPVIVTIALVVTGPLSQAPSAPLHPLHEWIFDQGKPSPADSTRISLASAKHALAQASTDNGPTRAAGIRDARRHLSAAREQLVQVTDTATRNELDAQLNDLEQLANQLQGAQQRQNADNRRQNDSNTPAAGSSRPDQNGDQATPTPVGSSPTEDSSPQNGGTG